MNQENKKSFSINIFYPNPQPIQVYQKPIEEDFLEKIKKNDGDEWKYFEDEENLITYHNEIDIQPYKNYKLNHKNKEKNNE